MPNVRIDINDEAFIKLSRKLKNTTPLISRVITRVATFMERTAKEKIRESVYSSPRGKYRRTGKSRQSIMRLPIAPDKQKVSMGVKHGKYLEDGTGVYNGRKPFWTTFGGMLDHPIKYKGMPARPFWKPAIEETKKNVPRILNEEAAKHLK